MEYRFLGRTGLKVSAVALGGMTFGDGADEPTSVQMLDRFIAAGGNFIDTANNYAGSEPIIGRWLKARDNRRDVIISSKVRFPIDKNGPNDVGLTRKHILDSVERSLRLLQTDYLDLYQAHCWDFVTPIDETLRTFQDLITAGKVRYIGASNYLGWHVMKALSTSEAHDWARYCCLQTQYSLIARSPEWEILPVCREEGVGVTIWSPLAAGWLSGKYQRAVVPPADSRMGHAVSSQAEWEQMLQVGVGHTIPHPHRIESEEQFQQLVANQETERRWRIIEAVGDIAAARGKTHAQVALAWLMAQPGVTAPVIGARTLAQLEDNLGCVETHLEPTDIAWLNQVSDPGTPYPIDFFNQYGIPWR